MPARFTRSLALVAALVAVPLAPALAETSLRMGYFDVKRVLSEVEDAKSAKNKLQKEFDEKQRQLDTQKDELEKLQKEFEQKSAVLSQAAKEQLAVELQTKAMKAQKLYVELQQDLAGKEQAALGDLIQRLKPVVEQIASDEGYTYIFEQNEAGLFYGPAAHDLTAQVIRRYNQKFPSKAPSAPAKETKGGGKK